jgi:hypothetical protein
MLTVLPLNGMSVPSAWSSSAKPVGSFGRAGATGAAEGPPAAADATADAAVDAAGAAGDDDACGVHAPTIRTRAAAKTAIVHGFFPIDSSSTNRLATTVCVRAVGSSSRIFLSSSIGATSFVQVAIAWERGPLRVAHLPLVWRRHGRLGREPE